MSWLFVGVGAAIIILALSLVLRWLRAGRPCNIGDHAPPIRASAARAGDVVDFDLYEALKTHAIVLYFFPRAFTAG